MVLLALQCDSTIQKSHRVQGSTHPLAPRPELLFFITASNPGLVFLYERQIVQISYECLHNPKNIRKYPLRVSPAPPSILHLLSKFYYFLWLYFSRANMPSRPQNIGIKAIEIYFPSQVRLYPAWTATKWCLTEGIIAVRRPSRTRKVRWSQSG